MSEKTVFSRVAEVVLSLGIPAVGYLHCVSRTPEFHSLYWQIPVILLASYHVITVNDSSFGKETSIYRVFTDGQNLFAALILPVLLLPALYFSPLFGALIFLTMLNWDIYSLKGKRSWIAGLVHNFMGGALHFLIGVAAAANFADMAILLQYWPEMMFFALVMTAGAMHHDSFDVDEDRAADYVTGAVKFSPDIWWRLAAIPFVSGTLMLLFADKIFSSSFIISSSLYLCLYIAISLTSNPSRVILFRSLCRLIFVGGALIYLYRILFGTG